MKIAYVTAAQIPSRWANSIQVVKMAQAFQQLGHEVDLITAGSLKQWWQSNKEHVWKHYGVSTPFFLTQLPLLPLMKLEKKVDCGRFSYGHIVARWKKHRKIDLVFARNYVAPYWSARLGIPTVAESHADVDDFYQKRKLFEAAKWPSFKALVTISQNLAEDYARAGVPEHKIIVEQDGVDLSIFDNINCDGVQKLRKTLLKSHKAAVLYAGHLYDYKGIPTVLDAAEELPEVAFILVGGWEHDVDRIRSQANSRLLKNVYLKGFVPNREIPAYLKAADILLLPNSANHAQAHTTSPLKLFEYMASGSPIVASKIENVTHVLRHQHNSVLVRPDNPRAMAEGIRTVLNAPREAERWAQQAEHDVRYYSWPERVKRIVEFVHMAG